MTGPTSEGRSQQEDQSAVAQPQGDSSAVLAGRAAPDPWAEGERNEQVSQVVTAHTTTAGRQVGLGRGTAFAQAQANAQGQARAAQAAAVLAHEQARAVDGPQDAALARASSVAAPAVVVPPRRDLRPTRPRKGLTLGRLHIGQVVLWQAAILASLAALQLPMAWLALVIAISVIVVVLTAVPYRGRWLYEWAGLRLRFATRVKSGSHSASSDQAVGMLARGGQLESFEIDEQEYGLITHDTGYTAVLEAMTPLASGQLTRSVELPPLDELIPAYDPDEPPVSVQIVVSTVPAPGLRGDDAVGQSYRELTEGRVPAQRRTWFAVQALHTPDVHSPRDMTSALVNVLRRVERKLEKAGLSVNIMRTGELREEFVALTNAESGHATDVALSREHWDRWQAGSALYVTFRILNWPDLTNSDGAELMQSLAAVPAMSVTVSVAVCREGDTNELEAAVRVASPDPSSLEHAVDQMERIAMASGAELQRMDGEHRFGVGASAPLGGFAS